MTELEESQSKVVKYLYRNYELTLNSGRSIWLANFRQWQTYDGVLEGIPWGSGTSGRVDGDRRYGEESLHCRTIIIDDREIPLPVPEEHLDYFRRPYRGMSIPSVAARVVEPVSLGPITCLARFESYGPSNDNEQGDISNLGMLWYQQEFAMPIDPVVLEMIKTIDWGTFAENFDL